MRTIPAFYFSRTSLERLAGRYRNDFLSAAPFEHVVLDRFLPPKMLNLVAEEFPSVGNPAWKFWGPGETLHTADKNIEKVGISDENHFGSFTRHLMAQFNSATFLRFLESLTGFQGLIADPAYTGCGLHSTGRGGRLMIHVDNDRFPVKGLRFHQRLNLILFLNKDWKEEYGGHLEFWDRKAARCVKKILPLFNRCVVFHTSTVSYHGHPHPLNCPPNRRRNSLALYYYHAVRPSDRDYDGFRTKVEWRPTTPREKLFHSIMKEALRKKTDAKNR